MLLVEEPQEKTLPWSARGTDGWITIKSILTETDIQSIAGLKRLKVGSMVIEIMILVP
jgi:hypothetical protein